MRIALIAVIFALLGMGTAALVMASLPASGSAPSIYDDFAWDSTSNGFWHVNAMGTKVTVKNSVLTLKGNAVELDRRIQTDPNETVVIARVRGRHFHKFGLGLGIYHSGTIGMEFDDDGVKCGRASDLGWRVDFLKAWSQPPIYQWFYLVLSVRNPYPKTDDLHRAERLADIKHNKKFLKPVLETCSVYDGSGHLVSRVKPVNPVPNTHYVGLDEAYMHTWDSGNDYQVDWIYAGPPAGSPARGLLK